MQKTALGIFFIIFVILLVINVFAFKIFESASQPITFENLLTELSHAPQIDMTLADTMEEFKVNYNGSNDFIQALVNVFNAIQSVFAFIAWLGIVIINIVSYIVYFLYLLGVQGVSAWI